MKKFRFISLFAITSTMTSIAQISIIDTDMPYQQCVYHPVQANINTFIVPNVGNNLNWDYSTLVPIQTYTNHYVNANSILFSNATLKDTTNTSLIIPGRSFTYTGYYLENIDYFAYLGREIFEQKYNISAVTGGANDSAKFQYQYQINAQPISTIKYPLTFQTSWNSIFSESVDFSLSIASASLYNAPCLKTTYYNRKDTVIGWGNMKIPTISGSIEKPVLMLKRIVNMVDSFFVAGSPAPNTLLSAFGLTQGMQTSSNRYVFWYKKSVYPLMIINFGSNNFTAPTSVFFDGDAISTKIDEFDNNISIYPNPTSDLINISGIYNAHIMLYDIDGKMIYSEKIEKNKTSINLSNINNGIYILRIIENNKIINKQIIINR